jgi:hypothetical protein
VVQAEEVGVVRVRVLDDDRDVTKGRGDLRGKRVQGRPNVVFKGHKRGFECYSAHELAWITLKFYPVGASRSVRRRLR